jgi:tetratricopeptide (TPR) repeat protein
MKASERDIKLRQDMLLRGPKPKDAWIQEDSDASQQSMIEKDSAIQDFEQGVEFHQDDLLLDIMQTRSNQRPGTVMNSSNIQKLIEVCTSKLCLEPVNRKALFIRASSYLKMNKFDEVQQDCNKLIDLDPMYAGAFYIRGCSYEGRSDFYRALQDYSKVLEIDPLHVNAVFARGACLNKMVNIYHD